MAAWFILEPFLMFLVAVFIITQMIVPALKGTVLFPFIRLIFQRRRRVEEKLRELQAAKEVQELEETVEKFEHELKEKIK